MEEEHGPQSPARERLTIEHVMPRKLTDAWKRGLGDEARTCTGRWRDRLANLTLCGDTINQYGDGRGHVRGERVVYAESAIGMTRRVAEESDRNEEAFHRRDAISSNVHPATRYPPDTAVGSR